MKRCNLYLKLLLIVLAVMTLSSCGVLENLEPENVESGGKDAGGSAGESDAGTALDENADSNLPDDVIEAIDAATSEDVLSEAEVKAFLEERGIRDCIIAYMDDIDGTHHEEEEITGDSSVKRPVYYAYFVTQSEEIWTVYVINGKVMAYPVTYGLERGNEAEVIFSESPEITCYDHNSNRFYVRIPDKSEMIVNVVDRIDAETLEKLTVEEIDEYEK